MVASAAAAVAGGSSSAAAYRELAPLNNDAAAVRAAVVGSTVDIVALTDVFSRESAPTDYFDRRRSVCQL